MLTDVIMFSFGLTNEAATLSLRKLCSDARGLMDYLTMLQWGRNFIVAEIPLVPTVGIFILILLQWGRNFIVVEM